MIRKFLEATGEYALFLKMVFRKPEKWKIFWKQLIIESDKLILSSILLVGVISLFIGGVLVIQTASNLENPIRIYGEGKPYPGVLLHYGCPDSCRQDGIQHRI